VLEQFVANAPCDDGPHADLGELTPRVQAVVLAYDLALVRPGQRPA
jgi:hypothetical protein